MIDYVAVTATFGDLPEADAALAAVELVYAERDSMSTFDAATIARKASGEVRFGRRQHQRIAPGDTESAGWSLAAGLAAALYPSVGVDQSADRMAESEILSASAGAVQRGLDRHSLSDLGRHLDDGPAGLIVVCRPAFAGSVDELIGDSHRSLSRPLSVDVAPIFRVCRRHGDAG